MATVILNNTWKSCLLRLYVIYKWHLLSALMSIGRRAWPKLIQSDTDEMSNTRLLNRTSLCSVDNFRSHGKKLYIDPYLNRRKVKYLYFMVNYV